MYNQNPEHKSAGAPPMSPRISFSNDFVESSHPHSLSNSLSNSNSHGHQIRAAYRDAPVSSDFEFSVTNNAVMTAGELFYNGRLLPLKESCSSSSSNLHKTTTLRDELLQNDSEDDGEGFSLRPPKNPTRWRGFLGLRKSHIGSKKPEKGVEKRTPGYNNNNHNNHSDDDNIHDDDDVQCSKNSQDFVD